MFFGGHRKKIGGLNLKTSPYLQNSRGFKLILSGYFYVVYKVKILKNRKFDFQVTCVFPAVNSSI